MSSAPDEPAGKPSYFLISVSTRENLEICIRHGLAGFPSGESGAWTFCEIQDGDFVSFLYGARAHNLYRVAERVAINDAERLPPWNPLTFTESGRTYSFPFRLRLEPVREFSEPMVRSEFYYVAENLLLRGGYRRTHFQADQTTLQNVSGFGTPASGPVVPLVLPDYKTFTPRFTTSHSLVNTPEVCRFRETILQSAIRRYLASAENLQGLLSPLGIVDTRPDTLEILGEKALTQGHIDLLLKDRVPLGSAPKIPIEVKTKKGQPKDIAQVRRYMDELRRECSIGVLVAGGFSKAALASAQGAPVGLIRYSLGVDLKAAPTFDEICHSLKLEVAAGGI